jgi:hypothetical protein
LFPRFKEPPQTPRTFTEDTKYHKALALSLRGPLFLGG